MDSTWYYARLESPPARADDERLSPEARMSLLFVILDEWLPLNKTLTSLNDISQLARKNSMLNAQQKLFSFLKERGVYPLES